MWKAKQFKTRKEMREWLEKRHGNIQYVEIFINNGYAVEWRWLRKVG